MAMLRGAAAPGERERGESGPWVSKSENGAAPTHAHKAHSCDEGRATAEAHSSPSASAEAHPVDDAVRRGACAARGSKGEDGKRARLAWLANRRAIGLGGALLGVGGLAAPDFRFAVGLGAFAKSDATLEEASGAGGTIAGSSSRRNDVRRFAFAGPLALRSFMNATSTSAPRTACHRAASSPASTLVRFWCVQRLASSARARARAHCTPPPGLP